MTGVQTCALPISYVTAIGKIEEDRQDPFAGQASSFAQVTVYLTPEQDRKRKVPEIIEYLRGRTKDIKGFTELRFQAPEAGPPVGKAVEAKIRGENFDVLDRISGEYMDYLATIKGTTDITWDHKPGKEEIRVKVDHNRSEEHTSELQSHSFISYAVFCLKKKKKT